MHHGDAVAHGSSLPQPVAPPDSILLQALKVATIGRYDAMQLGLQKEHEPGHATVIAQIVVKQAQVHL